MKKFVTMILFLAFIAGAAYYLRGREYKNRKVLSIYVPCGMTIPFKEISTAYESQHRNIKVEPAFDNANVLVKLIIDKGKKPDILVSPGKKEIGLVSEKGLMEDGSIKTFGKFELVLIAPSKSGKISCLSDLSKEDVKTIAIANPDFNSVGFYAKEALKSLGCWDSVQNKVLLTNTPIEALSFVAASKADAEIHYNACPFETDSRKVDQGAIRVVAQLPPDSHEPIYSYIGILKESANKDAARNFIDFVFSKKGNEILSQYGLGEKTAKSATAPAEQKAKVVIEAYYPFNEEHVFMKDYLESLEKQYAGSVKVKCVDFRNDEGYVQWRKSGLTCGGILINGKNKFTVNIQGRPKEVEFVKRMDMFWTKAELAAAIEQELQKQWATT